MPQTPGSGTRFPTSLDDFTMPVQTNYQDIIGHAGEHSDVNAAAMAVEAKLGIGATTPSLGAVLVGTGSGATGWTTTPSIAGLTVTGAVTLSNYAANTVLIGEAGSAVIGIAPSATAGVALVSQGAGADPAYSTVVVAGGGTGVITFTAYAVVCGGTTATGALQQVSGLGTNGQFLTSSGPGALPTWTTAGGASLPDPVTVAHGGTGDTTLTAFAVLCGGTTTTGAVQALAALGASGTVLTSNGAGALPSFQAASSGGLTTSIATLSSPTNLTNATPVDLLSLTLAAGTWDVVVNLTAFESGVNSPYVEAKVWDGSTTYGSAGLKLSSTLPQLPLAIVCQIVLAGSTTIKLTAEANSATPAQALATTVQFSFTKATQMLAQKVA